VIFRTDNLTKDFGCLRAVNRVSLEVEEGEIRAIIGPNGAGKTTFVDLIAKRLRPSSGSIFFKDRDITKLPPHRISSIGIGKCFQISKLFLELSVFENIQIACISRLGKVYKMFSSRSDSVLVPEVEKILASIGLGKMAKEKAMFLSYGDQRRLEIGITLAMQPVLLMLDEPTAGVSRNEGYELMKLVKSMAKERGLTVMFIEHDMDIVFNYSDNISVMYQGQLIATDKPDAIKKNQFVQEIYLGEKTS
jgi:branched-chain amino acid transport system ATP-binding protein